jgi:hypothetical protein
MSEWPAYKRARDLAGTVFPVSEAVILQTARKYNIGRKMGRSVIFSPEDCQQLYEALNPCSGLSVAQSPPIGSSGGPFADVALKKALELTTKKSRKKSGRDVRPKFSPSQCTVVALPQPSLKRR